MKFASRAKQVLKQKQLSDLYKQVMDPVKFQNFLKLAYKQQNQPQAVGGLKLPQSPGAVIQLNAQHAQM